MLKSLRAQLDGAGIELNCPRPCLVQPTKNEPVLSIDNDFYSLFLKNKLVFLQVIKYLILSDRELK